MKIPLYIDFVVNVFDNLDEYNKYVSAFSDDYKIEDERNGGAVHLKTDKNDSEFAIYVNGENYHYRVVIHETVHIIDMLCDYLHIHDTEFRAYSIENTSISIIDYMYEKLEPKKDK